MQLLRGTIKKGVYECATNLHMACVSLNVTRGPVLCFARNEADRDGPDRGELS